MLNFSPHHRSDARTAVALGVFDGVHLGHRAVLSAAVSHKELLPCAFTFSAPSIRKKQSRSISYLYSDLQKRALLSACGIRGIFNADFSDYSFHSGEAFAAFVLRDVLHASTVVCGADFRFGRDAAWDADDLRRLGKQYGFSVEALSPVIFPGGIISSHRIRKRLEEGDLSAANALLGCPYRITGVVRHGNELGRQLGFPTLNQPFAEGQCVPRHGVYAARALLGGVWQPAVTNIGLRPTIGDISLPIAETHVIGGTDSLYGETVTVSLHRFLRGERKFESKEALAQQLHADCDAVSDYFTSSGGTRT